MWALCSMYISGKHFKFAVCFRGVEILRSEKVPFYMQYTGGRLACVADSFTKYVSKMSMLYICDPLYM